MNSTCRWFIAALLLVPIALQAQDVDSLLTGDHTVFTSKDSLSIFELIDSLLQQDIDPGSQLAIRLSYNSNVLSAGRTLGIENFGLSPGISYYHKSGLYSDISAYWSKDFDPSYYLTVTSLGYMHDFSKHFSIMAGYDHYFYHTPDEDTFIPYNNTLSVTPILEFKLVTFSVNYSYYFGEQHVHRIMPGLNILLQKKKWLGLDRVAIYPSFYALFGNESITEIVYPTPREMLRRFIRKLPLYDVVTKNVFGIMNYAVSAPLFIAYRNWNFNFTYSYSIPKALAGEPLTISESSYLSGSITYFIDLKRNKKAL